MTLRDQEAVQQPADGEHDRPGERGADDRAGIGAEEREHAEAGHQVVGGVHAEHHEVAVGEVHHPHDAEDDAEPDAHQPVGAADQQAGGERLQRVDQHPLRSGSITSLRIDVEPHHPAFETGLGRRVAIEHRGIVPGNDVGGRGREPPERSVALEHLADIVGGRKHAAALDVGIEVGGVGCEHDVAALRLHADRLQALGVAADLVHGDAGRDLVDAVVEDDAAVEHLAHHGDDVLLLERPLEVGVAHAAPGGVGHLGVLQMIARARKQIVVAGVVVMQVADDDVLDGLGLQCR